ncbi:MAG: hypothetical protein M5U26_09305 [Planctomycetota bacterium]|nr:hypothetical protein [Planctomycetota bacterium]
MPEDPRAPSTHLSPDRGHWSLINRYALSALLGALLLGVLLPCVLTYWHQGQGSIWKHVSMDDTDLELTDGNWYPVELLGLAAIALVGCGPGALVLTAMLLGILRKSQDAEHEAKRRTDREFLSVGAVWGACLAFGNFPGYLVGIFLDPDVWVFPRVVVLFAVTGASCGFWIAWQVFREAHPDRGILPPFGLGRLVLLVLGWGALLWLFQPSGA